MTTEKILDRLAKIKRMAEGAAAIGSEHEAQAFADMLQKLLLDHKLEMTDLEFEQMEHEQPVEKHTIKPSDHGLKFKRSRIAWQEHLADVIARAHFCRILVHPGTNLITLVGRKEDIAVAEYLYVTLCRAVEKIATLALWRYRYEQIKVTGKHASGLQRATMFHREGVRRGRAAADQINLQPNAIGQPTSRKAIG